MRNILITLVAGSLLLAAHGRAAEGVQCRLAVHQYDAANSRSVLLYEDTVSFLKDVATIGFLAAFSVEIQFTAVDTGQTSFMVHAVTLGQPAATYSRSFQVEYGLPARIREIEGKGEARYDLEIKPLGAVDIDTGRCEYVHTRDDVFSVDPSAHFNIYYVPYTYGDFYWNAVKGLMETEYRRFKELNGFTLPGKYSLYLCPCPIRSVIWDRRFTMMVDPTRSIMFSVYHKAMNSTHPFLALQASILKNYGYSPPFLSEGYAGYLSDAPYAMKKILAAGRHLPLDSLLDTYRFFHADPVVADKTAATFVRYLIEQYTSDVFLELYRMADDLTQRESLERVYGKPVSTLEREWLQYVDTVTIKPGQLQYYAEQAEVLFDYDLMVDYGRDMLAVAENRNDSTAALSLLVRAMFFTGDYYAATSYQEQALAYDAASAMAWMKLGSYRMMNGYYDEALEDFRKAKSLDSANQLIDFNLAINHLCRGDEQAAREILNGIIDSPTAGSPHAESRITLANLMIQSGDEAERAVAVDHYHQAVAVLGKTVRTNAPSPQQQLWNGIAHVGLEDLGAAHDYLQTALYLETRPFYIGLINLWLGKLADVRGERDVARQHYGAVLSLPSAQYHQAEARKYLEAPFTL
ncbi:MAG TPA: hypothetical protein VMY05_07260 [Acidobacteriota bacterium]|nr:hypothetical protein [Acidobacteriota bacterium]